MKSNRPGKPPVKNSGSAKSTAKNNQEEKHAPKLGKLIAERSKIFTSHPADPESKSANNPSHDKVSASAHRIDDSVTQAQKAKEDEAERLRKAKENAQRIQEAQARKAAKDKEEQRIREENLKLKSEKAKKRIEENAVAEQKYIAASKQKSALHEKEVMAEFIRKSTIESIQKLQPELTAFVRAKSDPSQSKDRIKIVHDISEQLRNLAILIEIAEAKHGIAKGNMVAESRGSIADIFALLTNPNAVTYAGSRVASILKRIGLSQAEIQAFTKAFHTNQFSIAHLTSQLKNLQTAITNHMQREEIKQNIKTAAIITPESELKEAINAHTLAVTHIQGVTREMDADALLLHQADLIILQGANVALQAKLLDNANLRHNAALIRSLEEASHAIAIALNAIQAENKIPEEEKYESKPKTDTQDQVEIDKVRDKQIDDNIDRIDQLLQFADEALEQIDKDILELDQDEKYSDDFDDIPVDEDYSEDSFEADVETSANPPQEETEYSDDFDELPPEDEIKEDDFGLREMFEANAEEEKAVDQEIHEDIESIIDPEQEKQRVAEEKSNQEAIHYIKTTANVANTERQKFLDAYRKAEAHAQQGNHMGASQEFDNAVTFVKNANEHYKKILIQHQRIVPQNFASITNVKLDVAFTAEVITQVAAFANYYRALDQNKDAFASVQNQLTHLKSLPNTATIKDVTARLKAAEKLNHLYAALIEKQEHAFNNTAQIVAPLKQTQGAHNRITQGIASTKDNKSRLEKHIESLNETLNKLEGAKAKEDKKDQDERIKKDKAAQKDEAILEEARKYQLDGVAAKIKRNQTYNQAVASANAGQYAAASAGFQKASALSAEANAHFNMAFIAYHSVRSDDPQIQSNKANIKDQIIEGQAFVGAAAEYIQYYNSISSLPHSFSKLNTLSLQLDSAAEATFDDLQQKQMMAIDIIQYINEDLEVLETAFNNINKPKLGPIPEHHNEIQERITRLKDNKEYLEEDLTTLAAKMADLQQNEEEQDEENSENNDDDVSQEMSRTPSSSAMIGDEDSVSIASTTKSDFDPDADEISFESLSSDDESNENLSTLEEKMDTIFKQATKTFQQLKGNYSNKDESKDNNIVHVVDAYEYAAEAANEYIDAVSNDMSLSPKEKDRKTNIGNVYLEMTAAMTHGIEAKYMMGDNLASALKPETLEELSFANRGLTDAIKYAEKAGIGIDSLVMKFTPEYNFVATLDKPILENLFAQADTAKDLSHIKALNTHLQDYKVAHTTFADHNARTRKELYNEWDVKFKPLQDHIKERNDKLDTLMQQLQVLKNANGDNANKIDKKMKQVETAIENCSTAFNNLTIIGDNINSTRLPEQKAIGELTHQIAALEEKLNHYNKRSTPAKIVSDTTTEIQTKKNQLENEKNALAAIIANINNLIKIEPDKARLKQLEYAHNDNLIELTADKIITFKRSDPKYADDEAFIKDVEKTRAQYIGKPTPNIPEGRAGSSPDEEQKRVDLSTETVVMVLNNKTDASYNQTVITIDRSRTSNELSIAVNSIDERTRPQEIRDIAAKLIENYVNQHPGKRIYISGSNPQLTEAMRAYCDAMKSMLNDPNEKAKYERYPDTDLSFTQKFAHSRSVSAMEDFINETRPSLVRGKDVYTDKRGFMSENFENRMNGPAQQAPDTVAHVDATIKTGNEAIDTKSHFRRGSH